MKNKESQIKKNIFFEALEDVKDEQDGFKLSIANLVTYSNISKKQLKLLSELNKAFAKKIKKNLENGELNNTGEKYKKINNECKILYYKLSYYKKIIENFYTKKKNLQKDAPEVKRKYGFKLYTKKGVNYNLSDNIVDGFEIYTKTQDFKNDLADLKKFSDQDAQNLQIIKLPNITTTYQKTYQNDIQSVITAFESDNKDKIKIFMGDYQSLLEQETNSFINKVKEIEGRKTEDPPEETELSSEIISDDFFKDFVSEVRPHVKKMYEEDPVFKFEQGDFREVTIQEVIDKINEYYTTGINIKPGGTDEKNDEILAITTRAIFKEKFSKQDLIYAVVSINEQEEYENNPATKKRLQNDVISSRIPKFVKLLKDISKLKESTEEETKLSSEENLNNFIKKGKKLYAQFTSQNNNYPLFILSSDENNPTEQVLKLTKPYLDSSNYTTDLTQTFEALKEDLKNLGSDKEIIKKKYKDKEKTELDDILIKFLKLRRYRNSEIMRDMKNVFIKNDLRTINSSSGRKDAIELNKIKRKIMLMQKWYRDQEYDTNNYENVFLKGYFEVFNAIDNKGTITNNDYTKPNLIIKEKLIKLIKPLIIRKLKRKQNGKKNLHN